MCYKTGQIYLLPTLVRLPPGRYIGNPYYLSLTLSDLQDERRAVREVLSGDYTIVESYEADPLPLARLRRRPCLVRDLHRHRRHALWIRSARSGQVDHRTRIARGRAWNIEALRHVFSSATATTRTPTGSAFSACRKGCGRTGSKPASISM